MELKNVGKLCPLCKKGVIFYIKAEGGLFGLRNIEYTSCSNEKCDAHITIS